MSGIPVRVFLAVAVAALVLAAVASVLLVTSQSPNAVSQDLIVYGNR
jgi:hypothetical protein